MEDSGARVSKNAAKENQEINRVYMPTLTIKCYHCGKPIATGPEDTSMQGGEEMLFHPDCFAVYLEKRNKRLHRGLPARLYADPRELAGERLDHEQK